MLDTELTPVSLNWIVAVFVEPNPNKAVGVNATVVTLPVLVIEAATGLPFSLRLIELVLTWVT